MPVEDVDYIADLRVDWPTSDDPKSEGDNHLRNLKDCLQKQFPNLGTSVPVNASAEELNHLVGVTAPIQAQLDAVNPVEVGMRFLCVASALPTNGRWVLWNGGDDQVPLIRNFLRANSGGGWIISGLTIDAIPASTGLGAVVFPLLDQFAGGRAVTAVAFNGLNQFATSGADNGYDVRLSGTTESANINHAHNAPGHSFDGNWRPSYRETVVLELAS